MKRVYVLALFLLVPFFTKAHFIEGATMVDMKSYNASKAPVGDGFEVVLTRGFGSGSVVLERKTDNQSFRQNRDGSRFYKTTFTLKVNSGSQKWSKEMTDIYSDKGAAMEPCMLIDEPNKLLYVFVLSKSDDQMYGMDGIIFRLDMDSGNWTRENVFSKSNMGWYAYFDGLVNGNPELWHFSYSGYRNMCSTRNNIGEWSNANKGGIKPEQAANQKSNHNNILVIESPNVQITSSGGNVPQNPEKDKAKQVEDHSITTIQPSRINNNNEPIGPNNKYKNYQSLPDVGPIAGEFYVGTFTGNTIPQHRSPNTPPITDREMSMRWNFDYEKGCITFSHPEPKRATGYKYIDNLVRNETVTLSNGQQITKTLFLPDYKDEKIVITWINTQEQTGTPDWNDYFTVFQDHNYRIDYTLPINVTEAKLYYYFYQAKKGTLKDAINYARNCTKDNYRSMVENEIVNSKTNNISDIIYCNDNYPKLSERLENKMFGYISSMSDCNSYLKYYSASKKGSILDDKVYQYVNASNEVDDCETYLKHFPNGNHKAAVTAQKNEIVSYNAAKRGGKAECTTYLTKYPKGRFTSEIQNKKDGIVKEEQRQAQIKINSNKGIWKLGNKLCNCTSDGIIMATLDQWNEDHSSFKGIITASPGGLFQGDLLKKGNQLWFETKDWHKCLDEEVEYALNHDKSLEAEQLLKNKNMKFKRGTIVHKTYTRSGWIFSNTYRVEAKVDDWNEDFTRMKIQIVDTDALDYINGESIYEGKYIWVSPIGWE